MKQLIEQCKKLIRKQKIKIIDLKCIDLIGYLHPISHPVQFWT